MGSGPREGLATRAATGRSRGDRRNGWGRKATPPGASLVVDDLRVDHVVVRTTGIGRGGLLLGLLLSVQIFFRVMVWPLAAAIDKRPAFGAAFKLGGRIVWRACAATALVSGPFLVLNVVLGAAAFVWADGDPTRFFDKRFLFCVETVSNMLQALHLGVTTMACALIAKGAIPELFAGDPPPTQAAPGQTGATASRPICLWAAHRRQP